MKCEQLSFPNGRIFYQLDEVLQKTTNNQKSHFPAANTNLEEGLFDFGCWLSLEWRGIKEAIGCRNETHRVTVAIKQPTNKFYFKLTTNS